MIGVTAAAVCFGIGLLVKISSSSKKETCELLRRAIPVNELKGLGECLEDKEIKNPIVLVCGTVGSTSTVENSCLGVFIEEEITLDIETVDKEDMNAFGSVEPESRTFMVSRKDSLDIEKMNAQKKEKKMNASGSVGPKSKTITVSRKKVPWYLDDGTARVYVCDYQDAKGFYDTLKNYFSTESVITYLKIIHSDFIEERKKIIRSDGKEKMLITDVDCRKCVQVLEIGTYLTVVGRAVRDKDGAPMIDAYQFFNGHLQLHKFVTDLESEAESQGTLSLCVIALGAVLLGLSIMQTDVR